MELPFVSVVIPCRNERRFIAGCLQSVLTGSYPNRSFEVLVVDGRSDDGTQQIVEGIVARDSRVKLLDNPDRITPAALNIGIRAASGSIIVRVDSHCEYPHDYVERLVMAALETGADNVGGVWRIVPTGDAPMARAIAAVLADPAGVGDSHFHFIGGKRRWVDTVPFGCYRREIFDRIGLFDEDLVRNQDDEFNMRLRRAGGRILMLPEVEIRYFARDSLGRLWRTYFQYGYFKPLGRARSRGQFRLRHLVPSIFVLVLAVSAALSWTSPAAAWGAMIILAAYAVFLSAASLRIGRRTSLAVAIRVPLVLAALHFSYGIGFLAGSLRLALGWPSRESVRRSAPLTR